MVVDITYPNYGAYYEAGYAQALGKEVIICCRKENSIQQIKVPGRILIFLKNLQLFGRHMRLKDKLSKRITATVTK